MTPPVLGMRFFTDQNVPEAVARELESAGYVVERLRDMIATNTPDALVAAVSEASGAVLVTMDADFKSIAARTGIGRRRFRTLSILRFERCRESRAAERLRKALSLIEHEWSVGNEQHDRRMFVVIGTDVIHTHR